MRNRFQFTKGRLALLWTAPVAWVTSTLSLLFPAQAQVVPVSGSANTQVSQDGNVFDISGGAQAEGNLFHDFESFNLDEAQTANFLSDSGVFNIFGQVSGLSPSYIDGLVQVSGSDANLYLINPAGILFGPNGQLSLSGSFTATTADQVGFGENWLNVLASETDYAAFSTAPSAFAFSANLPGSVVNQGDLAVEAGESLSLLGSSVVNEGRLSAPGGEIGLVAVGGDRTVRFGIPGSLLSLEIEQGTPLGTTGTFTPTDLPTLVTGNPSAGATSLTIGTDGQIQLNRTRIEPDEVSVTGEITTRNDSGDGGTIALLSRSADVLSAEIDASGTTGGTVRIGRGLSEETNLPMSDTTLFDIDSLVRADGLAGAGGSISIGAGPSARLHGTISAQGETTGGFVETSADYLNMSELRVDANGKTAGGQWLIDPVDIDIVDVITGSNQVTSSSIESALDDNVDVEIETTSEVSGAGDIALLDTISQTGDSTASLTLTGRRFSTNGSTINLASTGDLIFNLNAVNPEATPGGDSVESAIAAIGNVAGDRTLNLGDGIYTFSSAVRLDTDVDIVGTSRDNTVLNIDADARLFEVQPDREVSLNNLTFGATTAGQGGGISNRGTLNLDNVLAVGNTSPGTDNGGAIDSLGDSRLTVANSEFRDNETTESGGAIAAVRTTLNISNSLFENNEAQSGGAISALLGSSVSVSNSRIENNLATNVGGAIRGISSDITLTNSVIKDNIANVAGGLNLRSNAVGNIVNTRFENNSSTVVGGGILAQTGSVVNIRDRSIFRGNASAEGGGIYASGNSVINIEASDFISNEAVSNSGGGILAIDTNVDIVDVLFDQNRANGGFGGGLQGRNSTVAMLGATFTNNTAAVGGGIALMSNSRSNISSTVFDNNTATSNGGGIYAFNNSNLTLDTVTISNNVAAGGGGLDLSDGTLASISNSQFIANQSQNGGGARVSEATANFEDTRFEDNVAAIDGGGLVIRSNSEVTADNTQFVDNRADDDGGGLYITSDGQVTLTNSLLDDNRAGDEGGGLYASERGIVDIVSTSVTRNQVNNNGGGISVKGNSVLSLSDSTVAQNTAADGGGIYSQGGNVSVSAGTRFERNVATLEDGGGLSINEGATTTLENVVFVENTAAEDGGGANVQEFSTITVENVQFVDNVANDDGGGLYISESSQADVSASRFENNSANDNGGGFYVSRGSIATVDDVVFSDNSATNRGGGLNVNTNATADLNNATFETNTANRGGAFSVDTNSTGNIEASRFSRNEANEDGGGVYINGDSNVAIADSSLTDNQAGDDGAGLYGSRQTTTTLSNVTFEGNSAGDAGGGVQLSVGSTLAADMNSAFVNNTAGGDGGGVLLEDTESSLTLEDVRFEGNQSDRSGGGIAVLNGARLEGTAINLENNFAVGSGGGIVLESGTTASLIKTTFEANRAELGGGIYTNEAELTIQESEFSNNQATADGGGLRVSSGMVSVENTDFLNNQATYGGGLEVSSDGQVQVRDSEFSGNEALTRGGAIYLDDTSRLMLESSTLAENRTAGKGAGLFNRSVAELVNTTLFGNVAQGEGGAIANQGPNADLILRSNTISNNESGASGGGITNASGANTRIINTIVAENSGAIANDVSGDFIDQGNNLIGQSDGSTGFTTSTLVGQLGNSLDPSLSPLADNGGATRTQLIAQDSFAVEAGADDGSLALDQRGLSRVVGTAIDIGAVEIADPMPRLPEPPEVPETPEVPEIPEVPETPDDSNFLTALDGGSRLLDTDDVSSRAIASLNNNWVALLSDSIPDADNRTVSRLEQNFGRSFEDYWDLPLDTSMDFDGVQSILRRAQEEYKVNSAIIYAVFLPEQIGLNTGEDRLYVEPTPAPDDLLHLALVMPEGELVRYQLPVTRERATRQVSLLRIAAGDPEDSFGYQPLTQQLYRWLLAPLEKDLETQGIQNLMYALDTGLRTAPITAMRDYQGFSLERYGISVVPNMGLTQAEFGPAVKRPTVAMGVSQFETASPLPAVPIELEVVKDVVSASSTVLNEETTIDALESVQALEKPGVLHLATHANFDHYSPESSSISMWDQPLSMKAFAELDWLESDLELLILSACSTALSSANAELGFAGLAAAAGVDATVGSLWEVSDVGTLALMSEFYTQLERTDLRFEALRQAQLSLLKGKTRIENGDLRTSRGLIDLPDDWGLPAEATLDHPFFWSAFTMVGNPW